ncbi:hypothetical protein, partial [Escherichia coli]|uniref:hypothetical protein n=1 Tax=Escherichia coli TaxID=562 RepID=UPI0013866465
LLRIFTLVPLLGPIGGGFGFGVAAPSAGGVAVEGAAAAAAASSAALTISLEEPLFFIGNITIVLLEADEFLETATLGDNTNPDAADAMLQLAMMTSS